MSLAPGLDRQREQEDGVKRNAADLLRKRGISVKKVLWVFPDSIFYVGSKDRQMTAWLSYDGTRLDVTFEPGMPAWPTPGLVKQPLLSAAAAKEDLEAA